MGITTKTVKILWAAAGGRCGFPDCWERLCYHEAGPIAPYTLGEMAHICGDKPGSNRHNPDQTDAERDDYRNLILLCPTHHTLIDRKENEAAYPVELLLEMKAAHEARILDLLDLGGSPTKGQLARSILPLLEESRQSWAQFGPTSELARSRPHDEAAHAVWKAERLSVIVPNNRKIAALLNDFAGDFEADEQAIVASFQLHERSYERWVEDETTYAAVKRFPTEFDDWVRRAAHAGV